VIAYETIAPGGDNGALISTVRVGDSKNENPAAATGRSRRGHRKSTPCRAGLCATGMACMADTKACTAELDASKCTPACASGSACIDKAGTATCSGKIDATKIYRTPRASAITSRSPRIPRGTIGIAYYDRTHGNLGVLPRERRVGSKIVDGADAMGNDTGDVGIGASLFIDASNDWHIAYVDGLPSRCATQLTGGTTPSAPEVIDDGLGVGATPFADGQHLVGGRREHQRDAEREVRVSYQDATAGKLHYAVGSLAPTSTPGPCRRSRRTTSRRVSRGSSRWTASSSSSTGGARPSRRWSGTSRSFRPETKAIEPVPADGALSPARLTAAAATLLATAGSADGASSRATKARSARAVKIDP